ncbi:YihY/virulence factor BrkB family protein [Microbispora bryophytorum]|uniref:YihY/virulence factor BrkB family protein n=1 Tax=Microbispora bryophytorum subsp. camponoti TaxID=1677852 RepID=A0ABR8L8P4_9ACTN|nr:YihY/virulence factor BrkB family protein [Microbispora camponoti]MBD3147292.1 YihY/virulence factor BrkB family protein [Microbispora camponoti]
MGTATPVPETRSMSGDELSADDAYAAIRRYGGWHLIRDAYVRFRYGDGTSNARSLAFQTCLAIIPGAIALVGLSSVVHQERFGRLLELTLRQLTPGAGSQVIQETLDQSHHASGAGGGKLALWLGLLTALVSLTTAMGQFERGANRIYGIERDRPFLAKYGRALLMAVTAGLLMSVGFVILVGGAAVGEAAAHAYDWSETTQRLWGWLRWPIGFLLAVLSISVLFRSSPRREQPGHSWLAVGATVAVLLWTLFTWLLALYTASSGTFGATYGPLTAVMALLLWSFLSSMALFLGLSFSAQLESCRAGRGEPAQPDPGPAPVLPREPQPAGSSR